jgi:drug/metabolite transporter (DMT)-like permease
MMSINEAVETTSPCILDKSTDSATAAKLSGSFRLTCRWEVAFVGAALLVVCGHLLIKAGLNATAMQPAANVSAKLAIILHQSLVWLGLGIYGLGTVCWMAAVAQTELSLLYPLTSLNYIFVAFLSYFLFGETISMRRGAGIATIALGMVLLTRSQQNRKRQL